jgi:cytochrome c biogenesis protein CcmG/thiol:disulfide interchange protein DsbE
MLRRALFPLAVVAVLASACTGGGVGPTPPPGGSLNLGTSPGATNATTAALLPTDRFALPTMNPTQFRQLLGQLEGTPVVVNFWASWCGPCRDEAPGLSKVAHRFGDKVQFVGVDLNDIRSNAQITIRDFAYPYPSISDPDRDIQHSFGFYAQPVTIFFDRDGNQIKINQEGLGLVDHYSGAMPEDFLQSTVARLASS